MHLSIGQNRIISCDVERCTASISSSTCTEQKRKISLDIAFKGNIRVHAHEDVEAESPHRMLDTQR
jgi:hypothetical protein